MDIAPGTRLGPYEIVAPLGAGGMGEVYRARDPRLAREVAIKVLPRMVSSDPERLARFEQEARAAAALNHPNILAVHDIGHHMDGPYIISELLEGETLRDRLASGRLSPRTAIGYAVQIAQGLAAAHDKGIVHRDLKPENIFLTADGRVKILDFGLAKLIQAEGPVSPATALPTTPPNTQAGVVLGTVGYMSPEQVRGRAADHRSDIFALGAILYEMIAGRRAFDGETAMDSMTAILKEEPADLTQAECQIPPGLQRVVERCLHKAPSHRFQTATDLAFALEALSSSSRPAIPGAEEAIPVRPLAGARVAWASAVVFLATSLLLAAAYYRRPAVEQPVIRAAIDVGAEWSLSPGGPLAASAVLALSPDGRRIAMAATRRDGKRFLLLRAMDAAEPQVLAATEGAHHPFWSPDSRSIGFFTEGKLKKIDIAREHVVTLCDAPSASRVSSFGGTWSQRGVIVFAAGNPVALHRVPDSGGTTTPLTTSSGKPLLGGMPFFLPDGRHFLYRWGGPVAQAVDATVFVSSIDGSESKPLLQQTSQAMYASERLVFARGTTLMAQSFDTDRLELRGEAAPIVDQLAVGGGGNGVFSVSADGALIYRTGGIVRSELVWFDRSGKAVGKIGQVEQHGNVELSPDGSRVVVSAVDPANGTRDLWILDAVRGLPTRFTHAPASNESIAVWSPDGSRLVFASSQRGRGDVYQKAVDGRSTEESMAPLLQGEGTRTPSTWSRDGRYLLYQTTIGAVGTNLWALPLFGERKAFALLDSPFMEARGRLSPDSEWITYVSNESGENAVYVATFPDIGTKQRVSPAAADWPRWRADGSEIFFLAADGTLVAVEVRRTGSRLDIGTTQSLFQVQAVRSASNPYDASLDGQRFLVNVVAEELVPPLTLLVNWPASLKQ